MIELRTDYVNAELDQEINDRTRYQEVVHPDGTKSFSDVSAYKVTGDTFGAEDMNATNREVNDLNEFRTTYERYLEATLPLGDKVVVIEDDAITTDSIIDIYTDVYGAIPKDLVAETGKITMTFITQKTDIHIRVRCM